MSASLAADERIVVGRKGVAKMSGLSVPTLDRMARDGVGPKRFKLSARRCGYLLTDVHEWIETQAAKNR